MTEAKRTEYVVLRAVAAGANPSEVAAWEELERTAATSAKAAITACVKDVTGTYVAVPARSFQPARVTVAQKATLSFGEPLKPESSA